MSLSETVSESEDMSEFCLTGGLIDLPIVVQTSSPDIRGKLRLCVHVCVCTCVCVCMHACGRVLYQCIS